MISLFKITDRENNIKIKIFSFFYSIFEIFSSKFNFNLQFSSSKNNKTHY